MDDKLTDAWVGCFMQKNDENENNYSSLDWLKNIP